MLVVQKWSPIVTIAIVRRPYLPVAQHQAVAPIQMIDDLVRFGRRVKDGYAFHRFADDALKAIGILPRSVFVGQ